MKELSIEEKAKRYDEALIKARNIVNSINVGLIGKDSFEAVFPELKESGDERIRKALIKLVKKIGEGYENVIDGVSIENAIAWLEKQGTPAKLSEEEQNKFAKGVLTSCALSFIDYLDAHKHEGKMCVSNGECEDIENAFHNAMWDRLHRYYCKYIEKQGEKPNDVYDKELSEILGRVIRRYINDPNIPYTEREKVSKEIIPYVESLEKQGEQKPYGQRQECVDCQFNYAGECKGYCAIKRGEQKPTDKVEPKFHEGEWITNGDYTWKIVEVKPLDYILQSQDGNIVDDTISHVDEQFHSFTIEDAKDGDVLCYKDEISLYKHDIKNCTKQGTTFGGFVYHCCYDGKRFITDSVYSLTEQDKMDIHPATREQRGQLEKAMTDAGYTFDFEKKELKKIEQSPIEDINGEDYGIDGLYAAMDILNKTLGQVEGYQSDDGILEHKAAMTAVKKLYKQQETAEWSEEDKNTLDFLVDYLLDTIKKMPAEEYAGGLGKAVVLLKSLKDRVQPQPKREWCGDDEAHLHSLITHLEQWIERNPDTTGADIQGENIAWLKSLRPQKQWKPSVEQLEALESATVNCAYSEYQDCLRELIGQLKKLKE